MGGFSGRERAGPDDFAVGTVGARNGVFDYEVEVGVEVNVERNVLLRRSLLVPFLPVQS